MNDLVTQEHAQSLRSALKNSLYPGAKDESVDMVLAYCKAARLDPMTKPVHIVPMSVKVARDKWEWRDVVMPGIELYRTKAHDTGEYAGQDEVEFGPTVSGKWGDITVEYPQWAKVTVYRMKGNVNCAYTAKVLWLESYATAGKDSLAPNAMWRKRPFGQIEKCAEALALRKAFPEAIGAHNTAEEMEGRVIDISGEDDAPRLVAQPQSKSAKVEAKAEKHADAVDAELADDKPKQESKPAPGQTAQASLPPALSDGMLKVLNSKLATASITMDALVAGFGDVTPANINQAFKWIGEQKS